MKGEEAGGEKYNIGYRIYDMVDGGLRSDVA